MFGEILIWSIIIVNCAFIYKITRRPVFTISSSLALLIFTSSLLAGIGIFAISTISLSMIILSILIFIYYNLYIPRESSSESTRAQLLRKDLEERLCGREIMMQELKRQREVADNTDVHSVKDYYSDSILNKERELMQLNSEIKEMDDKLRYVLYMK